MSLLNICKLGLVPYQKALELQLILLEKRRKGQIVDTLITLQHPHTFTVGRRGNMENLLAHKETLEKNGIHFEVVSRGGDITYHGPGQLVGYPVLDLKNMECDVHKYLRNIEETIILALSEYDIEARRVEGVTGVWTKRHKIASIGVGVKRWITYHGFALNVNTDVSYFDMIVPCGIRDVTMTSIQRCLASREEIDMSQIEETVIQAFSRVFGIMSYKTVTLSDIT